MTSNVKMRREKLKQHRTSIKRKVMKSIGADIIDVRCKTLRR
jgi:hypothetical protein